MCSKVTHRYGYTTLWFIINCNTYFRMMPFFCIHISQGSVATCLKRGGIFKHEFVANLLPSRTEKNFENRLIFSEVMAKSFSFFFDSRCMSMVTSLAVQKRLYAGCRLEPDSRRPMQGTMYLMTVTLASPGKYDGSICGRRWRCSLPLLSL